MNAHADPLPQIAAILDHTVNAELTAIATRLADEGVPVRAIARCLKVPGEELYTALKEAIDEGVIVELPKDDWPPGSTRRNRNLLSGTPLDSDDALKFSCARVFKATRLETVVLSVLVRRNEATKQQIHHAIEQNRPGEGAEETDVKMVDVVICKLRRKLKEYNLKIDTVWGTGYLMPADDRARAIELLTAAVTPNG
jgi:hypothetical protein